MVPNWNDHISPFCTANVYRIQVFLFLDEAGGDLWLKQAFISMLTIFCHKHKHTCTCTCMYVWESWFLHLPVIFHLVSPLIKLPVDGKTVPLFQQSEHCRKINGKLLPGGVLVYFMQLVISKASSWESNLQIETCSKSDSALYLSDPGLISDHSLLMSLTN